MTLRMLCSCAAAPPPACFDQRICSRHPPPHTHHHHNPQIWAMELVVSLLELRTAKALQNPLTCSGIRYRVKILDCEDLCLRLLAGQRGGFDRGGVGGVGGGGGGSFDGGFMGGSPMGSSLRAFFAAHATELAPALM